MVREDRDRRAGRDQPAHDRALAAVVDDANVNVAGADAELLSRGDGRHERPALHRGLCENLGQELHTVDAAGRHRSPHRTDGSEPQHEAARIDGLERDDTTPSEPAAPLLASRLAHEDGARSSVWRLVPALRDTVVADHRRREADELLREARIGRDLLVAGHPRREHGFAERDPRGADRSAREDGAVLEHEVSPGGSGTRPYGRGVRDRPASRRDPPCQGPVPDRPASGVAVIGGARPCRSRP